MSKANLKQFSLLDRASVMLKGKALRDTTPLQDHCIVSPRPKRFSSIAVLERSNHDRLEDLIPIRYSSMLASPFSFLRGSAALRLMICLGRLVAGFMCRPVAIAIYSTSERMQRPSASSFLISMTLMKLYLRRGSGTLSV